MGLFIASLLPLVLGPLLVRVLVSRSWAARLLDGFVMFSIGGLVFVHLLPHAVAQAGRWAVIAALVGLALPAASAKVLHAREDLARHATLVIGLLALGAHAVVDGVALGAESHHHAHSTELALAVVLHRLPVGLGIWWLVRPRLGLRVAVWAVACIVAATTIGFVAAPRAASLLAGGGGSAFQALVAGSLIHVVLGHRHTPAQAPPGPRWRPASAAGALLAVLGLWGLSHEHEALHPHAASLGAGETFVGLALLSAPVLLLAYVVRGGLHGLFPDLTFRVFGRARFGFGVPAAVLSGLPLSACSCGIVFRVRELLRRGLEAPATAALLVAGPELGIGCVLLSLRLLGTELGVARAVIALLVGAALGAWAATSAGVAKQRPSAPASDRPKPGRETRGLVVGLRHAFGDAADHTLPWFVVGLGVAAMAEALIGPGQLAHISRGWGVLLMAVVALPLHVCALASTPLLAVLVHKGLSPGAAVVFVLLGAATNVATLRLVKDLGGRRLAVGFALAVGSLAAGAGIGLDAVLGPVAVPLHELTDGASTTLNWICLATLAVLLARSLLRQGAEGFVGQILVRHGRDPQEHGHRHVHLHHR